MRKLVACLFLCLCAAIAQTPPQLTVVGVGPISAAPSQCRSYQDIWMCSQGTCATPKYLCINNTWTPDGGSVGSGNLTLQDNTGATVGSRAIMQILNGSYLTCALADTGTKLTQQCDANTVKLVDRTVANTWTAGAKQIFQVSATTEALNLAPAALPSAASAGALAVDAGDALNLFDGSAWNKAATTTVTLTSGAPLVGAGTNKIGVGTTTGTGSFVLATSPTISLPTIADFSNAGHNHTNAANGGTLPVAAVKANFTGTCDGTTALMGDGSCKTVRIWTCETGLGDGLNAMAAGTYLQTFCLNKTGSTVTLSSLQCFTDNAGTSTMNATNGAGTGLLTGAVTCSASFASGTQSATTTLANGDSIKFTFVADGASKQTTWAVSGSY